MGYFLLDRPNPHGPHFHVQRRGAVKAIVVHVTAGLETPADVDDDSAEATARYAASTERQVSWHSGSDTDSVIELLPPEAVAFHCQGYNTHTYGHEISKRHVDWSVMPTWWVEQTLHQAAAHLGPLARRLGVPVRQATRTELDRAIATDGPPVGFIGHEPLDPTRRRDPGEDFPWARFLELMTTTAALEEDDMYTTADRARDDAIAWLVNQMKPTVDGVAAQVHGIQADVDRIEWGVLDQDNGLRTAVASVQVGIAALAGRAADPAVVDLDEAALARQIAAAIPDTLAGTVADELARRLQGA